MANTVSNNRISNLVSTQLPFFVRGDHENFVRFVEAYYEYLEQDTKTVNRIKNVQTYQDIDRTVDEFADKLYENFLKFIPITTIADKHLLLKNIKDFYRARGTEKAARFLMRIAFNEEIDFYYPKKDVLRVSDGKWFIQKSLRISSTTLDNVSDTSLGTLERYISTRVTGVTSGASAIVERVDRFYEQGTLVDELILSNIDGEFQNNEDVTADFDDENGETRTLVSTTFGGIINSITINEPGSRYEVGDPVVILSNTGSGACVTVSQVTTGNLFSIAVLDGGAGFQVGNYLTITGGGGTGANGNVSAVSTSETIHPNTYNITNTTILVEANTQIGNAVYTNLNTTNAYSWIANGLNFWQFSNTGPATTILVLSAGSNYTSAPTISIIANSAIQSLGILGKMEIINGGNNYTIGDTIEFHNVPGGYGAGALGSVWNVDTSESNTISEVRFVNMPGHITGGSGYDNDFLPLANVVSATGTGANIAVTTVLGAGAELVSSNSTIGAIQRVVISNRGTNYEDASIDMTGSGDGAANLSVSILEGAFTYPGRYLNDDGFISSYNFLQDRDYYQSFSYVIKAKQSIDKYRQMMKELNHPAGTKMFGEYLTINETYSGITDNTSASGSEKIVYTKRSYSKDANTINISYPAHGIANGTTIYLEYESGGFNNVKNGIYLTTNVITDFIRANQSYYSANNTSGNVFVGIITT